MRFKRCPIKYETREITPRRRAAAARAIAQQKAKAGMFVDQYKFDTVDERLEHREDSWRDWVEHFRHHTAVSWIVGRAAIFSLPAAEREKILDEWNDRQWIPGSSEYFLDFLHSRGIGIGRIKC